MLTSHMPRFFVPSIPKDTVTLSGADAQHIARVLRTRPGEELTVCDGAGLDARCVVQTVSPDAVVLSVMECAPSACEAGLRAYLYQGFPKGDKFEWIVQKAVELGAAEVVPVLTARCVARPDVKAQRGKGERYQKIADEAAKQCGRGRLPQVRPFVTFAEALRTLPEDTLPILFYEDGGRPLRALLAEPPLSAVALFIGPEGGFAPEEVEQARAAGVQIATLGPRILRTETAGLCALSAVMYAHGELD